MPCLNLGSMIVCGFNPSGRLHVGGRYVTVDMHPYCGPSFSYEAYPHENYDPTDENDPIWPEFEKWFKRYEAAKKKKQANKREGV